MVNGVDVRPGKWSDVKDLYDDGEMSLILGRYDSNVLYDVGIRWNGTSNDDLGYPKCFGNPVWFVLPPKLVLPVLHSIHERTLVDPRLKKYQDEVYRALEYFCNRINPVSVQKLIGFFGVANTGKTSTLKVLVNLMIGAGWKVIFPETDWDQDTGDVVVVLDDPASGKRVIVNTGGDVDSVVRQGWDVCCKWRADIGVMASRKRDDSSSVQAIYDASEGSGASITWVAKSKRVDSPADATNLWHQEASALLEKILSM